MQGTLYAKPVVAQFPELAAFHGGDAAASPVQVGSCLPQVSADVSKLSLDILEVRFCAVLLSHETTLFQTPSLGVWFRLELLYFGQQAGVLLCEIIELAVFGLQHPMLRIDRLR